MGPLGDYGGPTWTMPLLPGSPAIDAGDPNIVDPPATDQRGFERIVDGDGIGVARIDIGAFEYAQPETPATAESEQYATTRNTTLVVEAPGVLANDTDAEGDALEAVLAESPIFGTVLLQGDGSFTYVPQPDFIGVDEFSYLANDGFVDSNEATVTITVGNWLGPIVFRELADIDPIGIEPWYGFETMHRGYVTLETSSEEFSVTLYDESHNELATSTPTDGGQRLDWQAGEPGEKYFFVVSAVEGAAGTVDVRLLNMVDSSGATLHVYGSEGAERFEFDAACIADPTAGPVVTVNGVGYALGSPELATVSFNGGGGDDVAVLRGTAGDETAVLRPDFAWLGNVDWDVQATDVEDATIYGQGGHDMVTLYDSPGNDHFVGAPVYAAMYGDGFYNRAWNFAEMKAEASAGGIDEAKFYDSTGDDTYTATPELSELAGPGYRAEARLFDGVHVYATAGGHDEAKFYDSPGNDMFVTTPTYAALFGTGFYNRAKYFESTNAYATAGGVDVAKLFDSPADDLFVATPTYAALSNPDYRQEYTHGYIHRANFFDGVHAYATAIGDDVDVAMLYDSPGDDTFYADPLEASLYKAGQYYNRARLFDAVHAYATAGGEDTALLSGSSGNDEFHADPMQAALFRTGDYYRRAKFFEQVYADGRGGDDDRADLLDSPEADLLQAEGNWARLSSGLSGEATLLPARSQSI